MSQPTLVIYEAEAGPRFAPAPPKLIFRFDDGEITVSSTLLRQLDAAESRRVAIFQYGQAWYITKVLKKGFWLNNVYKGKRAIVAEISAKYLVRQMMREFGNTAGERVVVPVATAAIDQPYPFELDPETYPYPLYRLLVDCKTLK